MLRSLIFVAVTWSKNIMKNKHIISSISKVYHEALLCTLYNICTYICSSFWYLLIHTQQNNIAITVLTTIYTKFALNLHHLKIVDGNAPSNGVIWAELREQHRHQSNKKAPYSMPILVQIWCTFWLGT